MTEFENSSAATYLYWPVYFKDRYMRYHMTCKYLGNSKKYSVESIVDALTGISTQPPDVRWITWAPAEFISAYNESIKVLLIHNCPQSIYDCHEAFATVRVHDFASYKPHITIDDLAWKVIQATRITPQQMGITFGPLTFKENGAIMHQFKLE